MASEHLFSSNTKVKISKHIKINFADLVGFKSGDSSHCPDFNGHKCPAEGNE